MFSKPIVRAFDERAATGRPYDVDSLLRIYSSGAMWSAEVKQQLLDRLPNVSLFDIMNSSEGAMATQVTSHETAPTTAVFLLNPTTKVFADDGREIEPGLRRGRHDRRLRQRADRVLQGRREDGRDVPRDRRRHALVPRATWPRSPPTDR